MKTINERLAQFVEHIGDIQPNGKGIPEVARKAGLDPNTLRIALRPGASKPSYDTITAVLRAYPVLSADWLMLGHGEMLKWGGEGATAAHAPGNQLPPAVPSEAKPYREGLPTTPGTATPQEADFVGRLITRLETELAQAQAREEYLQNLVTELLGKSPGSLLAAGLPYPSPVSLTPIGPRFDTELVEAKVLEMWKQAA